MPEAAEVELTRRDLAPFLNHVIKRIEVLDSKLVLDGDYLIGRRLCGFRRHGKLLGFDLDSGQVLAIHLRLTGNLFSKPHSKARLIIHLTPESCLSLVDPRRFATVSLVAENDFAAGTGPDLLDPTLSASVFPRGSRRVVKAVLLDQHVLAGVGNYLADEALWLAQVDPRRPASEVAEAEWQALLDAARATALLAIDRGGMSFSDFRRLDGSLGSMWQELHCYGHAGRPCPRCSTALVKLTVTGRGTTFCAACQH